MLAFKKPSNQLENPIYPYIKKQPPRFVNAGKHWEVSVGETLKSLEPDTSLVLGDSILAQSRNYNQYRYGVSSHKSVVNKAFRPPLQTQEDLLPLNRQPRKAVVGRINPGTGDAFQTKNNHLSNVDAHITTKIRDGVLHETYYCPISLPDDNAVLPDLKYKLPKHESHAGFGTQNIGTSRSEYEDITLTQKRDAYSLSSGFNPQSTFEGDGVEEFVPRNIIDRVQVSASSGFVGSQNLGNVRSEFEDVVLEEKNMTPHQSVLNAAPLEFDGIDYNLDSKNTNQYINRKYNPRSVAVTPQYTTQADVMHTFEAPYAQQKKIQLGSHTTPGGHFAKGYIPKPGLLVPQIHGIK